MKINFYATLRDITGHKVVELPTTPGLTAEEVLNAVIARFPALREELLTPEGRLHGHVHFFINGRDVQFYEAALQTLIEPNDVISVFPAVGGG